VDREAEDIDASYCYPVLWKSGEATWHRTMKRIGPICLPLAGTKLYRLCVDGEAYLGFRRTEPELWSAELRVGGPVMLTVKGQATRLWVEVPASLGPLLTLVNLTVLSATVSTAGYGAR